MDTLPNPEPGRHARQVRPRGCEPRHDVVRADRPGQPGMHVEHGLRHEVDRLERVEATEYDAVRRSAEEAADDTAPVLCNDEGGIEAVEPRLDAQSTEQAERQVVLGLVCAEKRTGRGLKGADVIDARGAHDQGAASLWPPSTGNTVPVTKPFVSRSQTAAPSSSAVPTRPTGSAPASRSNIASRSSVGHRVPRGRRDDSR